MYVFVIGVVLVIWALHLFSGSLAVSRLRINGMKNSTLDFKKYLWLSIILGFTSANWKCEFLAQSQLWRSQIWDYRRFLFSQAQTMFGFVALLVTLSLFLEISGFVLLTIAFAILGMCLVPWIRDRLSAVNPPSFVYLGLALFFLEICFKNSSLLMQSMLDSEIVFITTIDSALNLSMILIASIVLGTIIPAQGWSVIVSFLLYVNSQMSFLAMVFMIIGEFLGTALYLAYRARKWSDFYKKRVKGLFITVMSYLVASLVIALVFRYFFSFSGTFNQLFVLKWIHIGTTCLILVGLYISIMMWGHFRVSRRDHDVVISDVGLIDELGLSKGDELNNFIIQQLHKRREKLDQFRIEFQNDPQSRAKIPPFVLNQFENEMVFIDKVISN